MSNKKQLVEENLEELSKRIGLMIKQYNLLAESENVDKRIIFVSGNSSDCPDEEKSHEPTDLYSLVLDYNDSRGWSSSESCY